MRVDREEGARLDEALAALLPEEPMLAYANFAPIAAREGAVGDLHRSRFAAAARGLGVLVARDADGRPTGALGLGRREFESRHFGIEMARADPPLAAAGAQRRLAALRALYRAARADLAARGYRHLSAECSAFDRVACWVLQETRSFHVGTRITWMQALTGEPRGASDIGPGLRIEHFDRDSIARLERPAWRRLLEWSGRAFDRGPFVFDLGVPHERALRIYQLWTEKSFTGEWADRVIVVRDGDEVVAFHTMLLLQDLSRAAGTGVLGRGIGGTLPGYRGLFTALQRETSAARPLGASFLENEAQASTVQSIHVFGKLGHHCLRSTAIFHGPLDGGPAPAAA